MEWLDAYGRYDLYPPQFQAQVAADYAEKRTALHKDKATALAQLMNGEIDVEAYAAEEARVATALDDLTSQRIRAETLLEANAQTEQNLRNLEIRRLTNRVKAEIDYTTDKKAIAQFDATMHAIAADPDNVGRDFAEMLDEAHRTVLALRGVAKTAPAPAPAAAAPAAAQGSAPAAPRKPPADPPVTLRNLPSAATANAGGGVVEQMANLTGGAYEEAYRRLSPAQRRTLLDEAD